MADLNFISYNINGINNPIKRKKILAQLKRWQSSVVLFQETHLSEMEHLKLKREWVGQVYSASFANKKKRGVAILFSKAVCYNNENTFQDKEGRYVMVVGTTEGIKITIDCPRFFF